MLHATGARKGCINALPSSDAAQKLKKNYKEAAAVSLEHARLQASRT